MAVNESDNRIRIRPSSSANLPKGNDGFPHFGGNLIVRDEGLQPAETAKRAKLRRIVGEGNTQMLIS